MRIDRQSTNFQRRMMWVSMRQGTTPSQRHAHIWQRRTFWTSFYPFINAVLFCEMGFQPNSTITHIRTRCVVCACAIDIGRSPADSHSSTGRTAKVNDLAWIFLPLQTGIFLVGSFLLHLSHHHLRSSSVTLCFAFLGTVHSCYRMFHLQFIDICSFLNFVKIFFVLLPGIRRMTTTIQWA